MNEVPPIISGVSKSKGQFWRNVLILAAIFIAGVVGFRYLLSITPSSVVQADDGFKKAKATIDPEKLRAWALEKISKQSTNAKTFISNSEIPINIANLYSVSPQDVSVNRYDYPDHSYVEICWGGGFFHWMINIGPTNYTKTTGATNNFTTAEWVRGIYYSREDTRHPFK